MSDAPAHDHNACCLTVAKWVDDPSGDILPAPRFSAAQYWHRLKAVSNRFSISRISDITGLDCIGIPVVQATRPLALSNAVSQGKGETLEQAAIGAVMEAIETATAERVDWDRLAKAPAQEFFGSQSDECFASHLYTADTVNDWSEQPLTWTTGIDLTNGADLPVPSALVHTDYVPSSVHATHPFLRNTTGLGAGPTLSYAIRHGMQELLERKSTGRAETTHGFFERTRFDPMPVTDAKTKDCLETLASKHILTGFYLCPSDNNTITVWSQLLDGEDSPLGLPLPANGFACRPTLSEAITGALLEAVQTRVSVIAASRDDLTRAFYPRYPDKSQLAFDRDRLRQVPEDLSNAVVGQQTKESDPRGWFERYKRSFKAQNLCPVCIPVFFDPDIPLFVVRILEMGAEADTQ